MSKVLIFGVKDFAELAHFYLSTDSEHEVVGFCVDSAYLPESGQFCGLPVFPFETIESSFPPAQYAFFAPMSPANINLARTRVFQQIKAKGYTCVSYVSSHATIFGNPVGENCFILEDNTIQPFTTIGDNVVMWSGNHIGHHGRIGDHVFFTSHVVLSGHCVVEPYCFFGVNATIRDGLVLREGSFVAMAAAVMKDTEAWGVYRGNPARKSDISSKDLPY